MSKDVEFLPDIAINDITKWKKQLEKAAKLFMQGYSELQAIHLEMLETIKGIEEVKKK